VQRLYFAFPGGLPGFGLLLLRVTISLTALYEAQSLRLLQGLSVYVLWLLAAAGLLAIASVLVGFLTPIGCVLLALEAAGRLSFQFAGHQDCTACKLIAIDLVVMSSVAATVGPGAFSLDARLFGRREIIFPH